MNNLVLFTNAFLSYLLLFVICVCVVIVAVLIGAKIRKSKDAKDALASQTVSADVNKADTSDQI